jgi:hypothetical protein
MMEADGIIDGAGRGTQTALLLPADREVREIREAGAAPRCVVGRGEFIVLVEQVSRIPLFPV